MGTSQLHIGNIKIKQVLLLYKKSSYQIHFSPLVTPAYSTIQQGNMARFKKTHLRHFRSLKEIERILKLEGIAYQKANRGTKIDYARYDLVITVGGDGTLLEAAGQIKNQFILGVNSDPFWSVGRLCTATVDNFSVILKNIRHQKIKIQLFNRMRIQIGNQSGKIVDALNDILISHKNPAAMSRYSLTIGRIEEEQRSSGIWISTAAGSTGGIHSAGGKVLPITSQKFQYRPRELYCGFPKTMYRLCGDIVLPKEIIKVTSLMKDGFIFVDGCHVKFAFPFGAILTVSKSPEPLRALTI